MGNSTALFYNVTLKILGVSNPLENANSTDSRAILLNNYYNLARDYVLKDFDWNFASTFKELSLIQADGIAGLNKYQYMFNYPNDCVCARDVFEKGCYVLKDFDISSAENGEKVILSNCKCAVLRYTRRVEKEIYYPPEFTMALAHYLASLTSSVITGSIQKGEKKNKKYVKILKHAKMLNASESVEEVYDSSTYLEARN